MTKRMLSGPNYLEHFMCIGSFCDETCCSNWNVEIDPQTYKKYCGIEDFEFRKKIIGSILKFPFYKSSKNVCAKFSLDDNRKCPLLTSEKLCSIQLRYGEEYLCLTCHSFPRVTNCVDGKLERSLTLACPEACRVVLLNKEQFGLKVFEENESVAVCINRKFDTNKNLFFNKSKKYFYVFRERTMEILQDRSWVLSDRMLLVLIFYSHFGDLLKKNKEEEIKNFINSFGTYDKAELLLANQVGGADIKGLNNYICNEIFEGMAIKKNEVKDYKECYEMVEKGFSYPQYATKEEKQVIYEKIKNKHSKLLCERFDYIFENYLLNRVYGELFPFTTHGKLYDAFMILVLEYSLLRYHILAMAEGGGDITEELIVKLIYSYTKVFSHYLPFYVNMIKFMKMNFISGFRHLSAVIKDV